jgi:ferrous iron transport protein B
MNYLLIGQPNCGKSTIFNQIAGYKALESNFPGTTVIFTESKFRFKDDIIQIIDLPGTYSIIPHDYAERVTRDYILEKKLDVIINVADASALSRSLELTIELIELEKPMILVLNMIDTAENKGIFIDEHKLSEILGIPVVKTIGNKGSGIKNAIDVAYNNAGNKTSNNLRFRKDIEDKISKIEQCISNWIISKRFTSIKMLENDDYINEKVECIDKNRYRVSEIREELAKNHGMDAPIVISYERHGLAMDIFERSVSFSKPKRDFTEKIDDILMHPLWGYLIILIVIFLFFNIVFKLGQPIEGLLTSIFNNLDETIKGILPANSFIGALTTGVISGLSAGVGIAMPYIVPFIIGLSLLEDIGYLPRIAFLMDVFMHKLGLHGKSIIPLITGYGCNVPAILSTRNMNNASDKYKTAFLATFIPCSARTIVIMGLVGYYLGGNLALMIYVINIIVIAILGKILTVMDKSMSPGLVIEIPMYHLPTLKGLSQKTWFRLKDFIYVAFPIIIASSVFLSIINYFNFGIYINRILSPLTSFMLGLPEKVGVTLIFGVFRKELTLVMLNQALGTNNVIEVMTKSQIFVFAIFTVFYVPCVSTMAALKMELGWKKMTIITATTLLVAIILALIARITGQMFL